MKSQTGFTLIELVIVIVLLGVLAAIAVPRFVNLQDDAQIAQRNATAAAITSAMNINYAACAINNFTVGGDCAAVTACDAANVGAVMQGFVAGNWTIVGVTAPPAGNGSVGSCTLSFVDPDGAGPLLASPAGTSVFTVVRTAP